MYISQRSTCFVIETITSHVQIEWIFAPITDSMTAFFVLSAHFQLVTPVLTFKSMNKLKLF